MKFSIMTKVLLRQTHIKLSNSINKKKSTSRKNKPTKFNSSKKKEHKED